MSEFQQLIWEYEIFRDSRSDFKYYLDDLRLLEGEKSRATRKYEELKFSKDEILLVKQEIEINLISLKLLQIEILCCNFIINKLKNLNAQYAGAEIYIYYYTHLSQFQNKIRTHRVGCPEIYNQFYIDPISGNYLTIPWKSKKHYQEFRQDLFEKGLFGEDGRYYCGSCLCQVPIQPALVDFENSNFELENKINQLEAEILLSEAKYQSIQDAMKKSIESTIVSKKLPQITIVQSLAVEKIKNAFSIDWKSKNPPKVINTPFGQLDMREPVMRFHFGGFPFSDGKLFVGVGFETWRGDDLCISYKHWHLIDAMGNEVLLRDMTEEERRYAESEQLCGPGAAAPINL